MWNPFKSPLPTSARSTSPGEYGYPAEHYEYPVQTVVLDDPLYPDEPNTDSNSPETYRSNVGDLWPESHPEYDRPYIPNIDNSPGTLPRGVPSTFPAPGSVDLAMPRDTGGVPGTNTLLGGVGPVTGEDYANWSGTRADLHTPQIGNNGPVAGGPDYSSQLSAAYFQQQAAQFAREASNSAMVSAV